jgi:PEP-CTERM motif
LNEFFRLRREASMVFVKRIAGAAALVTTMLIGAGPAQAGFVVTFKQVGANVVATGSGMIDLTGLTPGPFFAAQTVSGIFPDEGAVVTGPVTFTDVDYYSGATGPVGFGSHHGFIDPSSGTGDLVGIADLPFLVVVPRDYVSESSLSDTSTYSGETFSSLGVTPGTYEWTWGTGADQNLTLIIGDDSVKVPEPPSLALFGVAVAGLLVRARPRSPDAGRVRNFVTGLAALGLNRRRKRV